MTTLLAHTMCSASLVSVLATAGCLSNASGDDAAATSDDKSATTNPTPCEQIDATYGGLFSQLGAIGNSTLNVHLPSPGKEWELAQAFAPSTTGRLSRVRLGLRWTGDATTDTVVSLIDLGGNLDALTDPAFVAEDHVIATADVSVAFTESWVNVPFANQPAVTAGKPYAIEVHRADAASPNLLVPGAVLWDAFNAMQATTIDPFPTGKSFLRNPTTNNAWTATPTAFGITDQVFETYVIGANCR